MSTSASSPPLDTDDPINARILAVSEDQLAGFWREPFAEIAHRCDLDETTVIDRLAAMHKAGVIRRIRQTLLATNLAHGALVAWKVPGERLNEVFDWMNSNDPFTGHVVIRSTDPDAAGAAYRLWTTLKVPQGFSLERHCELLRRKLDLDDCCIMPALRVFRLGVGHVRRRGLAIGAKAEKPAREMQPRVVQLDEEQWRVLVALKRDLAPDEIHSNPWWGRARELGIDIEAFCGVAEQLNDLGVIGRFSTFLEHARPTAGSEPVVRYNGLFHWAVEPGREIEAGREVGRFHILTHAYWRRTGPQFNHVAIMAVAHGTDRQRVLAHKQAIDEHLAAYGIPVRYTNVFWGGRSEIKPSEIAPDAYLRWCEQMNIDAAEMRTDDGAD
jgi:DNA-binding Lrp family transcriptional regulator